ncbi:MAG: ribosomal protein S18-alanine N-acetyltransferase [Chloroflexi bacterium]|nr:ribosomal protein S18-alanine N-acetyltransferase [Chloroflexota bacterium]
MIDYVPLAYRVEPMRPEDIGEVMEIEHVAFSAPWSARAYDYELHYNEMARYYVARAQPAWAPAAAMSISDHEADTPPSFWRRLFGRNIRGPSHAPSMERSAVLGYSGLWLMVDEAHISTLASHPQWRRRGIGELLLLAMMDGSAEIGANIVTLEVRASNVAAQALYRKYGFQVAGRRKGYYSDNGEDALIMTTPQITTPEFVRHVQGLKRALFEHLAR